MKKKRRLKEENKLAVEKKFLENLLILLNKFKSKTYTSLSHIKDKRDKKSLRDLETSLTQAIFTHRNLGKKIRTELIDGNHFEILEKLFDSPDFITAAFKNKRYLLLWFHEALIGKREKIVQLFLEHELLQKVILRFWRENLDISEKLNYVNSYLKNYEENEAFNLLLKQKKFLKVFSLQELLIILRTCYLHLSLKASSILTWHLINVHDISTKFDQILSYSQYVSFDIEIGSIIYRDYQQTPLDQEERSISVRNYFTKLIIELCLYSTIFHDENRAKFLKLCDPFFQGPFQNHPKAEEFFYDIFKYITLKHIDEFERFTEIHSILSKPTIYGRKTNILWNSLAKESGELLIKNTVSILNSIFGVENRNFCSLYALIFSHLYRDFICLNSHEVLCRRLFERDDLTSKDKTSLRHVLRDYNAYKGLTLLNKLRDRKIKKFLEWTAEDSTLMNDFLDIYPSQSLADFPSIRTSFIQAYLNQRICFFKTKALTLDSLRELNAMIQDHKNAYKHLLNDYRDFKKGTFFKDRKKSEKARLKHKKIKIDKRNDISSEFKSRLREEDIQNYLQVEMISWLTNYQSHGSPSRTLSLGMFKFTPHKNYLFDWFIGTFSYSMFQDSLADQFFEYLIIEKNSKNNFTDEAQVRKKYHNMKKEYEVGEEIREDNFYYTDLKSLLSDPQLHFQEKICLRQGFLDFLLRQLESLKQIPFAEFYLYKDLISSINQLILVFDSYHENDDLAEESKTNIKNLARECFLFIPFFKKIHQSTVWSQQTYQSFLHKLVEKLERTLNITLTKQEKALEKKISFDTKELCFSGSMPPEFSLSRQPNVFFSEQFCKIDHKRLPEKKLSVK